MINLKELGFAAVNAYLNHPALPGTESPKPPEGFHRWNKERQEEWTSGMARAVYFARTIDQDEALEAAGKAAIAKIIPPVQEDGGCSFDCPFLTENMTCSQEWMIVKDVIREKHPCDLECPGPKCPIGDKS